jgi:hypothetical protein
MGYGLWGFGTLDMGKKRMPINSLNGHFEEILGELTKRQSKS